MARSHQSTVTALDELIQAIDEQYSLQKYDVVASLVEGNLAEVWYGFQPGRLREILGTLIDAGVDTSGVARMLHTAVSPAHEQLHKSAGLTPGVENLTMPVSTMMHLAEAFELRLRGRADLALRVLDELDQRTYAVQPLFDTAAGWNLLISVQAGITAMLAGDFTRALGYFTEAQLHVRVPTLKFLHRDAHVKAALVHAIFGDTEDARTALAHAEAIPRTSSWAEALIDANVTWVSAVLEPRPDKAARILLAVPLHDIGELWPFYALILHRVLLRAGRWKDLGERLATLEKLPFPKVDREGFTGSVFSLIRAAMCLGTDDENGAKWHLENSDQSIPLTRMLMAQLEFDAGRYQRAITLTRNLAERVRGLRQLEVWRYAILAMSSLELGRTDAARESLRAALELSGEIRAEDLRYFTASAHEFAREHIDGWHLGDIAHTALRPSHDAETTARLTDREREILRYLARGEPRTEIADQLFISLNTLKSHLRKIYNKLGVSSRDAAILRAEREGWL